MGLKRSALFLVVALMLFSIALKDISAQVVINEFMVTPNPEWVEFYNASASAEYIKNYWIDDDNKFADDTGNSGKKLLSGLNTDNSSYPYFELNSFLNNPGDDVVLFDQDGNQVDFYHYSSNPGDGISMGRSPDNSGSFTILNSATKGSANSGPKPDPTSTPEPTDTPTKTPTSVPTSKPTPTIKKTSSLTPRVMPQQDANDSNNRIDLEGRTENTDILGLRNKMNPTDNDVKLGDGGASDGGKFPWESVLFILSGGGFIGSGVYLYRKYQKEVRPSRKGTKKQKISGKCSIQNKKS